MRISPSLALIVAAVVALGSGCAGSDSTTPADEPVEAGSVGVSATEGQANAGASDPGAEIPEEELQGELVGSFPSDHVPLYPGDVVSSLGKMSDYSNLPEWNVDIATADSFDDVDAAIRAAYAANGWDIASENKNLLGGNMLIARSGDFTATITYQDAETSGTSITYGVSQQ